MAHCITTGQTGTDSISAISKSETQTSRRNGLDISWYKIMWRSFRVTLIGHPNDADTRGEGEGGEL